jgi:iron(III) transport system permease protein
MPLVMVAIGSVQRAWVGLRPEYIQWSLEGYVGLFVGRWSDIFVNSLTNSAIVGIATGFLALLLALMISYMSVKTDRIEGTILSYFSYAPIAIPGIVLASALQWIIFEYNGLFGFLYGSFIILVISFTAKFLVYGVRATNSSLRSVGDNLGEMARISGSSRFTVVREIYGPLIAPGLLAGFIIILIDTTKSLSLPIILGGNQFRLVQSTIWFFITQSELNVAAAYSVLLILGMSVVYMIAYKFDLDITSI